ncbi:hypothetical protein LB523_19040 [Mesorhizobium sp. ESP-6-4]|uniref:hypothetical protein n=1 Tax=Mesorhizobium sp. ESP-6-4 TaxID=2876624 RepID=UPI001CCC823A|nr:hypothetical protein [Mesorhizobium sp. ESP-6-4]MBZ9661144.1 hypothetical protein [Mesorhizobium sp. ESP-6-4]
MGKEHPFVEDTLGKKLKAGTGLSVSCLTCKRMAVLDMAEMVKRLGPDHSAMHWGLIKVVYCHECRAAGRDDRNLQFTNHAMTPKQRKGSTPLPISWRA